ncbi:MAG TPA: type II toxin-antitoxin system ParD family antitoxin [Humisphaera sp.]
MTVTLPPDVQKLIDDRVRAGRYASAEDVIAAAVGTLAQQESFGDFGPGEMNQLLAAGEQGGADLDGEAVFAEVRALGGGRSGR